MSAWNDTDVQHWKRFETLPDLPQFDIYLWVWKQAFDQAPGDLRVSGTIVRMLAVAQMVF